MNSRYSHRTEMHVESQLMETGKMPGRRGSEKGEIHRRFTADLKGSSRADGKDVLINLHSCSLITVHTLLIGHTINWPSQSITSVCLSARL